MPEADTIAWGLWLRAAMREGRKHVAKDEVGPRGACGGRHAGRIVAS